jgi:hypothetical protein
MSRDFSTGRWPRCPGTPGRTYQLALALEQDERHAREQALRRIARIERVDPVYVSGEGVR